MIIFRRFIPLAAALGVIIVLELILIYPGQYIALASILSAWSLITLLALFKRGDLRERFLRFLISILALIISTAVFLLFVDVYWIIQIIIIIVSLLIYVIYSTIFAFLEKPLQYQPYALENMFSYANLTSIFLLSSTAFSLILILYWSRWIILPGIAIVLFLIVYQTLWVHKVTFSKSNTHVLAIGVLLTETFIVLTFLPTGFYINGLLLAVIYYIAINVSRYALIEKLDRAVWRRYLIIGSAVIVLTLATARWI